MRAAIIGLAMCIGVGFAADARADYSAEKPLPTLSVGQHQVNLAAVPSASEKSDRVADSAWGFPPRNARKVVDSAWGFPPRNARKVVDSAWGFPPRNARKVVDSAWGFPPRG